MHVGMSDLESCQDFVIARLDRIRGYRPPLASLSGRGVEYAAVMTSPRLSNLFDNHFVPAFFSLLVISRVIPPCIFKQTVGLDQFLPIKAGNL